MKFTDKIKLFFMYPTKYFKICRFIEMREMQHKELRTLDAVLGIKSGSECEECKSLKTYCAKCNKCFCEGTPCDEICLFHGNKFKCHNCKLCVKCHRCSICLDCKKCCVCCTCDYPTLIDVNHK